VGTGDAFVTEFLAALFEKLGPVARRPRAVLVSHLAVGCPGDGEGFPSLPEISLLSLAPGTVSR